MSAWIVSKAHIDVLVHALGVRELFPDGLNPDEVGALLWRENHASVDYRYDEASPQPPYAYQKPPVDWSPGALLTEIACYEYQSCEHPGWDASTSKRLMETLSDALVKANASRDDSAPWGVPDYDDDDDVVLEDD